MEDNATQDITRKFDQEGNIGSFRTFFIRNWLGLKKYINFVRIWD